MHESMDEADSDDLVVVVIGAGLVGSLATLHLLKAGFTVDVYEKRPDPRTDKPANKATPNSNRSINLAVSVRGFQALEAVGAAHLVKQAAVPMVARMIHPLKNPYKRIVQAYGSFGEAIYSVERDRLAEILLNLIDEEVVRMRSSSSSTNRVNLHFQHKLQSYHTETGILEILDSQTRQTKHLNSNLVIGCDGAYSRLRRQLLIQQPASFNSHLNTFPHQYKQLRTEADEGTKEAKMPMNYLHIWPRRDFMLIALPNLDGSFTLTLFAPESLFKQLITDPAILSFFQANFPDILDYLNPTCLLHQFQSNPTSHLFSVDLFPFHWEDRVVLLGDAAHAILPFYGQGMNCGFEDLRLFMQLLGTCNPHPPQEQARRNSRVFQEFSRKRSRSTKAISTFALQNYHEMSTDVTTLTYRLQHWLALKLQYWFPRWCPMRYTLIAFTDMDYADIALREQRIRQSLAIIFTAIVLLSTLIMILLIPRK